MLLIAILLPPLYFVCVSRWGMAIITAMMALVALALVFLIAPPLLLWAIAGAMAIHDHKKKQMLAILDQHAQNIGRSVAANMQHNST